MKKIIHKMTFLTYCLLICISLKSFNGRHDPNLDLSHCQLQIIYVNTKGENLLSPKTKNYFNKDSIRWEFLSKTTTTDADTSSLSIFYQANDNKIEAIIHLNKKTQDTITLLGDNALRRVLYNKKEIQLPPDIATSENFPFAVVK